MLKDYCLLPLNKGKPEQAVIFLHGLGDRGDGGLLNIGKIWQRALPGAEFICPDAPFVYDMAPVSFGGRQWFSMQNFAPEQIEEGVQQAAPFLDGYIDHVMKTRELPAEKIALVGFSQGSMMALYVAPRREQPVASVIGYSGMLRGGDKLKAEKKSSPPILLVHGAFDEVVPYGKMGEAAKGLKKAGLSVTTVTCPELGHSIDDRGILEGLKFLQAHF